MLFIHVDTGTTIVKSDFNSFLSQCFRNVLFQSCKGLMFTKMKEAFFSKILKLLNYYILRSSGLCHLLLLENQSRAGLYMVKCAGGFVISFSWVPVAHPVQGVVCLRNSSSILLDGI